ncbi:hypothetical protein [Actinacidiphila paucisporea]|uniref:hypothetical protein n=1 Tax=Actinacidiphila paucisporea TaxID=310782 RepID=UPI0013564510|nr:hypothetical protein [Actinacidiphila paucisporea]
MALLQHPQVGPLVHFFAAIVSRMDEVEQVRLLGLLRVSASPSATTSTRRTASSAGS